MKHQNSHILLWCSYSKWCRFKPVWLIFLISEEYPVHILTYNKDEWELGLSSSKITKKHHKSIINWSIWLKCYIPRLLKPCDHGTDQNLYHYSLKELREVMSNSWANKSFEPDLFIKSVDSELFVCKSDHRILKFNSI